LANVLGVMPITHIKTLTARLKGPHIFQAAVGTGVVGGLVTGLVFLPALAAIGVGAGVALIVGGTLIAADLCRRVAQLEAEQRTLRDQLPEHLTLHEASIERLHGVSADVIKRVERLERQHVRPDLRELTDLATEQGWEWWRSSDVVRFASPTGIELTFELPVEERERRIEIASQLEAFGLRWSAPPTRITASQTDRSREAR
jgi:hypothetical protein